MVAAGAALKHIRVALGPSIGPCCYEVDENLGARFAAVYRDSMRRVTAGRSGKAMIDLRGLLADQLHNLGVSRERIEAVGPCTRCAVNRFFSRRGAGGVQCGLQLSFIGFMDDHR
jgi:copper oxidase (laccase) domain-containing protein